MQNEGVKRKKEKIHPPSESTATFVRDWLIRHKKDYPYSMWKAWCARLTKLGMKPPQYASFIKYMYVLRRAKLVRRTESPRKQPSKYPNLRPTPPSYYELNPLNIEDEEAWRNPQVAVWGEKMRFGRRRYRRRVMQVTALTRGRPKKPKLVVT